MTAEAELRTETSIGWISSAVLAARELPKLALDPKENARSTNEGEALLSSIALHFFYGIGLDGSH